MLSLELVIIELNYISLRKEYTYLLLIILFSFCTEGAFSSEISKYPHLYRKFKFRDYKMQQQRYYTKLLKEIIMSRQVVKLFFIQKLQLHIKFVNIDYLLFIYLPFSYIILKR